MKMWVWIILLVIISVYNTFYSFLPERVQNNSYIKLFGILAASMLLIYGLVQIIIAYKNYSYVVISQEGEILKKKNFPWEINKSVDEKGTYTWILEECYKDATEVSVHTSKSIRVQIYNAIDGLAIKFFCGGRQLPRVKIVINK